MHVLTIAFLAALLQLCPLISATPVPAFSTLAPRGHFCANAPNTIAGTKFDRRVTADVDLHDRAPPNPPVIWCVGNTNTYIQLVVKAVRTAQLVASVMSPASEVMLKHIFSQSGDGPIPQGFFEYHAGPMTFVAVNANNHQLTWGVLKAAMDGLSDYFVSTGKWGDASFDIYDGANQVGQGVLSGPS